MISTPYSNKNQLFSDAAHMAAQSQIYPALFNVSHEQLKFTSTSLSMGSKEKILDGEMAVDRIISVKVKWFTGDIEFTIQERFRRKRFMRYQDVTITEWNHATNQKGELFKLNAGIFVYGYFDDIIKKIVGWIAFDTTHLLFRLISRQPKIKTIEQAKNDNDKNCIIRGINPRSKQSFLTFKFEHLDKSGVTLARG